MVTGDSRGEDIAASAWPSLRSLTLEDPATTSWGCSSSPVDKVTQRGTEASANSQLLLTSCVHWWPILEADPQPSRAYRCLQPWSASWLQSHKKPQIRTVQLSHSWIPDPRKLGEIINVDCCLKTNKEKDETSAWSKVARIYSCPFFQEFYSFCFHV